MVRSNFPERGRADDSRYDFDVLVVGSGFGGSVAALRLTEKGYRVGVLEMGRRWEPEDFPETNWKIRDYLWAPSLGLRGPQRYSLLADVLVLSVAGVGGGSLLYANTLFPPLERFYDDPQWAHIDDWRAELAPFYDQARRMLGATETPFDTPADAVLREVAERMGVGDTFGKVPVGVFTGEPGVTVPDPYFGGAGPRRVGCIGCAGCDVGCRFHAKNTLDRNYLWLAERGGARILPERKVVDVVRRTGGGYAVASERPGAWVRRQRQVHTAEHVVLAAGVLGTLELLFTVRERGRLPHLSPRLGELMRTNSEAVLGVTARARDVNYAQGTAITSVFHPDPDTSIQPVRYSKGSDFNSLLTTLLVDGGGSLPRWRKFLGEIARHPVDFLRSLSAFHWAERTMILLIMQSLDNSLTVYPEPGGRGVKLRTKQGMGEPNPAWIPSAHRAARLAGEIMNGVPVGSWADVLSDAPVTAHLVGGATLGDSPETGVVDTYNRVYGHPGLHVHDAAAITANIGMNPALTITAMAERAAAYWPNRGEPDPRPDLGAPHRPVRPVAPRRPAVPASAPARYEAKHPTR